MEDSVKITESEIQKMIDEGKRKNVELFLKNSDGTCTFMSPEQRVYGLIDFISMNPEYAKRNFKFEDDGKISFIPPEHHKELALNYLTTFKGFTEISPKKYGKIVENDVILYALTDSPMQVTFKAVYGKYAAQCSIAYEVNGDVFPMTEEDAIDNHFGWAMSCAVNELTNMINEGKLKKMPTLNVKDILDEFETTKPVDADDILGECKTTKSFTKVMNLLVDRIFDSDAKKAYMSGRIVSILADYAKFSPCTGKTDSGYDKYLKTDSFYYVGSIDGKNEGEKVEIFTVPNLRWNDSTIYYEK